MRGSVLRPLHQHLAVQEIILHTLFESGISRVQDVERYISDDVERHGTRLGDLEKKLVGAYREVVRPSPLVNSFLVLILSTADCSRRARRRGPFRGRGRGGRGAYHVRFFFRILSMFTDSSSAGATLPTWWARITSVFVNSGSPPSLACPA